MKPIYERIEQTYKYDSKQQLAAHKDFMIFEGWTPSEKVETEKVWEATKRTTYINPLSTSSHLAMSTYYYLSYTKTIRER